MDESPAQEERKTLTVVFCDLKDSTKLGERLDPEPLGEVLDLYFTAMTRVLKRHGGSIEKFIGDAVVAAFGIPVLHEDDALRAVRAAVEMGEALARLNVQLDSGYGVTLTTRIGVHTGEVVIRTATTDQQVLTGDTLNTAARLEQTAGAGEILIGEPTYRLVRGAVEVEAMPPLELKGKGEPVPAYRLHRVFGDEQSARRHLAPLVGRTDELRALVEGFERAAADRTCRLVTVLGEAGVGKSRLVRALIDSARDGATVLRGRCLPYGESITFWPLLAIVREAAGIDQDEAGEAATAKVERLCGDPEVARRIASALDWSSEELPLPELFWGIRELFEGLARDRPLVVVIDDVHWAAPTLLELIEDLRERVTEAPMLLVCTARPAMLDAHPEWGTGPSSTLVMLDRLPDDASAQLLANMTGGLEIPEKVRARVLRAAEGNPLFVEQLVSMLTDRGLLVQAGRRWEASDLARIEIPPSIQALLAARLDALEADERGVVDPASVIGLEFPSVAVTELAPAPIRDITPQRLDDLVRKRLVRQEHSPDEVNDYRFDHLLIRDAAYAGVLKRARAELHERFADWLEGSEGTRERDEVIGYHLEQAARYRAELGPMDDRGRTLATRASVRLGNAGRRAFARGDLPAAIDLLRRGRDTLPADDVVRIQLVPDLAEALLEGGEFNAARGLLAEMTADATDDTATRCALARADLVGLLADLYSGHEEGWLARAHETVDRLMPVFEAAGNDVGLTSAWRVRNIAHVTGLRYDAGFEAAEHIIRHAEVAGDTRQQRRGALAYAIAALHGPTPVGEAIPSLEALLESVEGDRRTEAVIMLCLSQLLAMDDRIDRAREMYRAAQAMLDELGQSVLAASTSTDSAPVEAMAGDLRLAAEQLRRDDAALEELGEAYLRATVAGLLAGVLVASGDFTGAEEAAMRARDLAGSDDIDAQVLWQSSLARCYIVQGRTGEAVDLADAAVALTADVAAPMLRAQALTDRAVVRSAAGRPEECRRDVEAAIALHIAKGNRRGTQAVRDLGLDADPAVDS